MRNAPICIRTQGTLRHVLASGGPFFDELGQKLGAVVVMRDITDRKKHEEDLLLASKVFEHVSSGLMVTDAEGIIQSVNSAFAKITGYSQAEAIGQYSYKLGWEHGYPGFFTELRKSLLDKGTWQGQIWSKKKNGEAYLQGLTITAIIDQQNRITTYVYSFIDITEPDEAAGGKAAAGGANGQAAAAGVFKHHVGGHRA